MKSDRHELQNGILKKLSYNGQKTFSELKGGEDSNKISFHLNRLREEGLIKKEDDLYTLTSLGREILPYIELENSRHPIVVVNLTVFKNDAVFLQKKTDPLDPFSGDYRTLTSRIGKGERLEQKVRSLYTEEFGTKPGDLEKAGVFDSEVTFSDGSIQHYLLFFFRAKYTGEYEEKFYPLTRIGDMQLLTGLDRVIKKVNNFGEPSFIGTWDVREEESTWITEDIEF